MKKLISTNPANNFEIIWEVNISTNKEIIEKVEFVNKAKTTWKELWLKERIKLITPICKEFNFNILPENLKNIYTDWYKDWELCSPKDFWNKTLDFLETSVAKMFKKQVEELF